MWHLDSSAEGSSTGLEVNELGRGWPRGSLVCILNYISSGRKVAPNGIRHASWIHSPGGWDEPNRGCEYDQCRAVRRSRLEQGKNCKRRKRVKRSLRADQNRFPRDRLAVGCQRRGDG